MISRFAGSLFVSATSVILIAVGLTAQQPAATDYLVQFGGPIQEAWKAAVIAEGAQLEEYVPAFAFRAHMQPDQAARVRRLSFVTGVDRFGAGRKLKSNLARNGRRPYLVRLDRRATANAVAARLAAAGLPVVARGRLLMITADALDLDRVSQIDGVAAIENFTPWVRHNEFGGGAIMGAGLAGANGFDGSTQTIAIADTGLGDGTAAGAHNDLPTSRIGSIFNWPGTPDACFDVIYNDGAADVDTGHGTHVATAALGGGDALGVARGTAPAARLVFQAVENYAVPSFICSLFYGLTEGYYLVGIPANVGDLFQQGYTAGARVHSDSWGSEVAGDYTTSSADADAFVWAHRDMAITFSAGNSGVDADDDGVVDLVSINAPATAKNVITVGASENDRQSHWECDPSLTYTTCAAQAGQNSIFTYGSAWPERYAVNPLKDDPSAGNAEQMAAFSSRGPTADGRIKPDVVAPGTWTLSGYSDKFQQQYDAAANPQNGGYQYDGWGFPADQFHKYMGGTSMAAPLVAGGAAVVRDFFEKTQSHPASAALVKATLINTAVDLLDENNDGVFDNQHPIPNMHEGWGRVDLVHATNGELQFDDENTPLSTGSTAAFTYPVVNAGLPFKVSLVWSDYPSSESAAVNLVNDLDLTVTAPDGTTYTGNAFTGGWSATGGVADRLNNVENVFVFSAAPGDWTVTVSGYNIPNGPQPFALVVDVPQSTGGGLPAVRVLVDDATATEAGPTSGRVHFTRSGDTAAALTVSYLVTGNATPDSDYVALPGTLTFAEGAIDAFLDVTALDDLLVESAESVTVTLAADNAYTISSPSSGAVTITSDDLPPDLNVSAMTAPALSGAGSVISVTDTTRNLATAPAPASETGFYLSTNNTFDASDVFLSSRTVPALAAGALDTQVTSLTIPVQTATGNYYVLAKADWSGAIAETSETNNVRASSMMRVGPDLIVSAMTAPATAEAGETVTVSATTKNQGGGAAPASTTTLYLSTNTTLSGTDVPLGSRTVPPLSQNAVDVWSAPVTIPPSTAAGTYYILAQADAPAELIETIETNNLKASSAVKVGPDLTVTIVTAPAIAAAGDSITVNDSTKNVGAGSAAASHTSLYLSTNTALDVSDVLLGTRAVPALAENVTSSGSTVVEIPASTGVGTYYVIAKADDDGVVGEVLETNNTRWSGVLKIGPDLLVSSLTGPSQVVRGATIVVTDTTINSGGAGADASTTTFYLSTNGTLDASDVVLGSRAVAALAANQSSSGPTSLTISPSQPTGNYYIIAKADTAGVIGETGETNNTRTLALKINP